MGGTIVKGRPLMAIGRKRTEAMETYSVRLKGSGKMYAFLLYRGYMIRRKEVMKLERLGCKG
jgi:hypothetical protein